MDDIRVSINVDTSGVEEALRRIRERVESAAFGLSGDALESAPSASSSGFVEYMRGMMQQIRERASENRPFEMPPVIADGFYRAPWRGDDSPRIPETPDEEHMRRFGSTIADCPVCSGREMRTMRGAAGTGRYTVRRNISSPAPMEARSSVRDDSADWMEE